MHVTATRLPSSTFDGGSNLPFVGGNSSSTSFFADVFSPQNVFEFAFGPEAVGKPSPSISERAFDTGLFFIGGGVTGRLLSKAGGKLFGRSRSDFMVGPSGVAVGVGSFTPSGLKLTEEAAARLAGRLEGQLSLKVVDDIVASGESFVSQKSGEFLFRLPSAAVGVSSSSARSTTNVLLDSTKSRVITIFKNSRGQVQPEFVPYGK